jgi:hypothetical protein
VTVHPGSSPNTVRPRLGEKNKAFTSTFSFLQHRHFPGADERCTVAAVGQLNSLPLFTQIDHHVRRIGLRSYAGT